MRIAICDDNPHDIQALTTMLQRYLTTHDIDAAIDTYSSGEALLSAHRPNKYQIVFQDIYMSGLTGLQTAARIRETDPEVAIILTTTSLEHGIAGYRVSAAYYLVKPVTELELAMALSKCKTQIDNYAKTVEIMENRRPIKLKLRNITTIESQGRACLFTLTTGTVRTNSTIDHLEQQLGGFPFLRCHRSYIVNLLHITDMRNNAFHFQNNTTIPISKTHRDASEQAFKQLFRLCAQSQD